jgi:hypothetical protein
MDDDGSGEVVERRAEGVSKPGLNAVIAAPDDAFEERVDEGGKKRMRSATPPEMMAPMAAAKVARKKNLTRP